MNRRTWVVELIQQIARCDTPTAELLVERLMDEGLLHIGYGDKDVDAIVEAFKQSFGTTKATRYDRYSARRLADKYGSQAVVGIIRLLADNTDAKYAPIVGSVTQLEEKWVSVLNFVRKQSSGEIIDV